MSSQIKQLIYTHEDLLKLMLRDQNIHEGYWTLLVRFGFAAANIGPSPDEPAKVDPSALVGVTGVGMERADKLGPLTLDAAVVNPKAANL